jgi:aminoglycoside phosphotransferase (APT) family kinase protein
MTPETIEVLPQNRIDEAALARFLADCLPEYGGELRVRQFPAGFSNPTYALETVDRQGRPREYVLRKRPAGDLLPSAHRVDREFRVLRALARSEVPVPTARVLCENPNVLGQSFFIMNRVRGRLLPNPSLPGCSVAERRAVYDDLIAVLARIHAVDVRAADLADFGKSGGYLQRQVELWQRQYRAAETEHLPDMEMLGEWLSEHVPASARTTLVHGDYRTNNVLLAPAEPRVAAVLDWELSTLGDPISDLAYTRMCYYLPDPPVGFGDVDPVALGIPSQQEFLATYCRISGLAGVPHWNFYMALQMFKSASILQGVYKRALAGDGTAAALQKKEQVRFRASVGLGLALAKSTTTTW